MEHNALGNAVQLMPDILQNGLIEFSLSVCCSNQVCIRAVSQFLTSTGNTLLLIDVLIEVTSVHSYQTAGKCA